MPYLLAAHAMSGCDTVGSYFDIGKSIVIKIVKLGQQLNLLGKLNEPVENVLKESTEFLMACYGKSNCKSMSELRVKLWKKKLGPARTTFPKLCSLPPQGRSDCCMTGV